ncbi:hypothetical protein [Nocardia australiensis]|uniref:hypothetical protein n=1 Tax=Nocardia australiensis TaxID=2887191 RepID=UPI001D1428BF|nr:hypothetical protein [Nocardia australiensis]
MTTPFSESGFTLKYCPAFPERFSSTNESKRFCDRFFDYYSTETATPGSAYTPASVHNGTASAIRAKHTETLTAAYTANPDRFRRNCQQQSGSTRHRRRTPTQNKQPEPSHPV